MNWLAADFELETFGFYLNFTCNLPPGVEMAVVGGVYETPDPI